MGCRRVDVEDVRVGRFSGAAPAVRPASRLDWGLPSRGDPQQIVHKLPSRDRRRPAPARAVIAFGIRGRIVDEEGVPQLPQPVRDRTDRRLCDHKNAEQAEQKQQRSRQVGGHRTSQWRAGEEPREPARPSHGVVSGGEVRNSARQVHDSQRAQCERGPTDQHSASAVRIAGTADKPPSRAQAEQRQRHRAHTNQKVQHRGDGPADRPGRVKPDRRRREDSGTKRGKRRAIPLLGFVDTQVAGTTAAPAHQAAQKRGRGEPETRRQPDRFLDDQQCEGPPRRAWRRLRGSFLFSARLSVWLSVRPGFRWRTPRGRGAGDRCPALGTRARATCPRGHPTTVPVCGHDIGQPRPSGRVAPGRIRPRQQPE